MCHHRVNQPSGMGIMFTPPKKWTAFHIRTFVWQLSVNVRIAVSRVCTFQVLIDVRYLSRKVFFSKNSFIKINFHTIKCTHLKGTVWRILTNIYTCVTNLSVKVHLKVLLWPFTIISSQLPIRFFFFKNFI